MPPLLSFDPLGGIGGITRAPNNSAVVSFGSLGHRIRNPLPDGYHSWDQIARTFYFPTTLDAPSAAAVSSITGFTSSSIMSAHSATCSATAVGSSPSSRCQPRIEPGTCQRPTVFSPSGGLPPVLRNL